MTLVRNLVVISLLIPKIIAFDCFWLSNPIYNNGLCCTPQAVSYLDNKHSPVWRMSISNINLVADIYINDAMAQGLCRSSIGTWFGYFEEVQGGTNFKIMFIFRECR